MSRTDESIDWSIEMEKVAVLPVPDWAWGEGVDQIQHRI